MRVVYIAGPYRGSNAWEVEQNIRRAELRAFEVAQAGMIPLCPHTMYRFFDGTITDQFWLDATVELLLRCDAILLPGFTSWKQSEGSVHERDVAESHGIIRFYQLEHLLRWRDEEAT